MKRSNIPDLISFFLLLMFGYAAASKLMEFDRYKVEMHRQHLPNWSVGYLVVLIPLSELITIVALLFRKTRTVGFYAASVVMFAFTVYVGLAMTGAFGKVPCSCGGVISELNWPEHFVFNLIFLTLSIYGIIVDQKERRFIGK